MGYVKEECVKAELPDHHDAELLLRLYDLRRETKLREARAWLVQDFKATSFEEYQALAPMGSEHNAFLRMTVGYWDMAASLVNRGLISPDLFFENTGEFWIVWDRVRTVVLTIREKNKNPMAWKNLETLADSYEKWMAKRAPEALASMRERLAGAGSQKPSGSK
jgi:hypothetical protein